MTVPVTKRLLLDHRVASQEFVSPSHAMKLEWLRVAWVLAASQPWTRVCWLVVAHAMSHHQIEVPPAPGCSNGAQGETVQEMAKAVQAGLAGFWDASRIQTVVSAIVQQHLLLTVKELQVKLCWS